MSEPTERILWSLVRTADRGGRSLSLVMLPLRHFGYMPSAFWWMVALLNKVDGSVVKDTSIELLLLKSKYMNL